MFSARGWRNMEFTYTVTIKIKAPFLNPPYPPKSGMFFPPSYVFLKEPSAIGSHHCRTSFTNDNDSDDLTAPHQQHLLPPSMLIELVDWPSAMPTTHACDVDLVIAFRASRPASLKTTHVRTCARLSSSTCGSSRLSLMLASRLLANKEKPSVIPSSL